ncbi:MAG: hypothetical protein SFU98_08165 [Leptospiraceae bacterium]|nr:hypothetical protein [Leptospiraceae bacterium]
MNTNYTIEWAPFELTENAKQTEFLAASEILQSEFLDKQEGFIRRELLHLEGRKWVDLVYWKNQELAHKAMENSMNHPVCQNYFHFMVPFDPESSAGVLHLTQKEIYKGKGVSND